MSLQSGEWSCAGGDQAEIMRKELERNLVSVEIGWAPISLTPDSIRKLKKGVSLSRQPTETFLSFGIRFLVSL